VSYPTIHTSKTQHTGHTTISFNAGRPTKAFGGREVITCRRSRRRSERGCTSTESRAKNENIVGTTFAIAIVLLFATLNALDSSNGVWWHCKDRAVGSYHYQPTVLVVSRTFVSNTNLDGVLAPGQNPFLFGKFSSASSFSHSHLHPLHLSVQIPVPTIHTAAFY